MIKHLLPFNVHALVYSLQRRCGDRLTSLKLLASWGWDLEELAGYWHELTGHKRYRDWFAIAREQKNISFSAAIELFQRATGGASDEWSY